MKNIFDIFYFSFSILFFAISLLCIFRASTNALWKLSIGITEWPHILSAIILVFLLMPWWNGQMLSKAGALVFFISLIIALSPVYRAYVAQSDVQSHFIKGKDDIPVFSLKKLFAGGKPTPVKTSTHLFHSDLTLDFYPTTSAGKSPCIIMIHGGAWNSGDNKMFGELNNYLAAKGYSVAAISYRLSPAHKFPAQLQDVKQAIDFLKNNQDKFRIDSRKFILAGRSAGGQIALLAAYVLNDASIKGVISFYAPADMIWGYSFPGNPLLLDSRKVLEDYLGGTYDAVPDNFKASSPIEFVTKNAPPTLLIHGIRDEMVAYEHSTKLKEKLDSAGVKNYLITLPWATHGADYNFNGPSAQISTYAIERFLEEVVK